MYTPCIHWLLSRPASRAFRIHALITALLGKRAPPGFDKGQEHRLDCSGHWFVCRIRAYAITSDQSRGGAHAADNHVEVEIQIAG